MAAPDFLLVGLGNPGPRYTGTSHNVGFWLADRMAQAARVTFRADKRVPAELAELRFGGSTTWLVKPTTFMNRSGQAVGPLASYYRVPPERILAVHDDLDLPPGTARLKRGGGHGGHNGLRSLISHLGSDFLRLRIGIGHPGKGGDVVAYVLSTPEPTARQAIEEAIERGLEVLPDAIGGQWDRAVQRLHTQDTNTG